MATYAVCLSLVARRAGRTTPTAVVAQSGLAICKGRLANGAASDDAGSQEMRPIGGQANGTPPTASQRSMGSDFLQRKVKRCESVA